MAKISAPSAAAAAPVGEEEEGHPFLQSHHQPQQPCYGIPAPPPQDPFNPPHHYLLLPLYRLRRRRRPSCRCFDSLLSSSSLLLVVLSVLLLSAAVFFLWPSDPELRVVRLQLDHIDVRTRPFPSLDISLQLEVRVRNRDFFSLDYQSLVISIGYRGKQLGFVTSGGGHIRARGVSYLHAHLRLDGIEVLHDVFYLIEDLARGSIPFDTVTQVDGKVHLLFIDIPIQGRMSCAVHVSPENQTVIRQDCYAD